MHKKEKVVPELFILVAGWYEELQAKLCHAYVTCPLGIEKKVTKLIEKEFIKRAKEEIVDITERYGDCLLHRNDDEDGCAFCEDEELEWNIDPDDIEEYGVSIKADTGSIFIMFDAPVYYAHFGDFLVAHSNAMEGAIEKAAEKYEGVQYYIYEGFYTIDTRGDDIFEYRYYSSIGCVPKKDTYIGEFFRNLWQNDDFWKAFEEIIEDYVYRHGKEDTKNEILRFLNLYGNDIGEDAKNVLCEHLGKTDLEI